MNRVYSQLMGEHDWHLVMLAGFVCLFAMLVAGLIYRARKTRSPAGR